MIGAVAKSSTNGPELLGSIAVTHPAAPCGAQSSSPKGPIIRTPGSYTHLDVYKRQVWGLALVMATVLLRQEKEKSDRYLFAFGTVMGGAYEYICSAVTELLFGTVFWDYSKFKFNLGGRINLLYCFFWGIAAVIWMRYGYPLVEKGMATVRSHVRPWMTAVLAVFMAVNMLTSALALARYDARTSGEAPQTGIDTLLDDHFDDARMERIYPNAKKVAKAG